MRRIVCLVAFLGGCAGGSSATVEGTAMGISLGDARYVYYGGPFLVISAKEVDCMDVDWVRRSYPEGTVPTEDDRELLQFAFATSDVTEGQKSVGLGASVTSTILSISGGALTQSRATAGTLTVATMEEETLATGSFSGLTFEDGTLSGEYEAEWCVNLKDR